MRQGLKNHVSFLVGGDGDGVKGGGMYTTRDMHISIYRYMHKYLEPIKPLCCGG